MCVCVWPAQVANRPVRAAERVCASILEKRKMAGCGTPGGHLHGDIGSIGPSRRPRRTDASAERAPTVAWLQRHLQFYVIQIKSLGPEAKRAFFFFRAARNRRRGLERSQHSRSFSQHRGRYDTRLGSYFIQFFLRFLVVFCFVFWESSVHPGESRARINRKTRKTRVGGGGWSCVGGLVGGGTKKKKKKRG